MLGAKLEALDRELLVELEAEVGLQNVTHLNVVVHNTVAYIVALPLFPLWQVICRCPCFLCKRRPGGKGVLYA